MAPTSITETGIHSSPAPIAPCPWPHTSHARPHKQLFCLLPVAPCHSACTKLPRIPRSAGRLPVGRGPLPHSRTPAPSPVAPAPRPTGATEFTFLNIPFAPRAMGLWRKLRIPPRAPRAHRHRHRLTEVKSPPFLSCRDPYTPPPPLPPARGPWAKTRGLSPWAAPPGAQIFRAPPDALCPWPVGRRPPFGRSALPLLQPTSFQSHTRRRGPLPLPSRPFAHAPLPSSHAARALPVGPYAVARNTSSTPLLGPWPMPPRPCLPGRGRDR